MGEGKGNRTVKKKVERRTMRRGRKKQKLDQKQ